MNYNDNILTAIDTLIDGRLKELKMDTTIVAIISNIISDYGKQYEIIYEGQKFTVYSLTEKYKIGDSVYIKVPQSDFSNRLYIEGLTQEELGLEKISQQIIPIGAAYQINFQEDNNLSFMADELALSEGYVLLSMKIKNTGNLSQNQDTGIILKRSDKNNAKEIIFNTLDFEGNYFKMKDFYSRQTKVVKIPYDLVDDQLLFSLQKFSCEINNTRVLGESLLDIKEIMIQPIKIVDFQTMEFYSYIYKNGDDLKLKIYKRGIDITNACGITWYYKEQAADKTWTVFSKETGVTLTPTQEYYSIKAEGKYDENVLEAFWGNYSYTLEDNARCFLYNDENKISKDFLKTEYILGCNYDKRNEMIKWIYTDDQSSQNIVSDSLFTPAAEKSMLKELWSDNDGKLHYKIKENFNRNAHYNLLEAMVLDKEGKELRSELFEIYFVKNGDQGTIENSEYNIIFRPCDKDGNLIYEFSTEQEERYRVLLFKEGKLIPNFSKEAEYFFEKNCFGYQEDDYEDIFEDIGKILENDEIFIYEITKKNLDSIDEAEEAIKVNFIHFSFNILNSSKKTIRYTLIRNKQFYSYPQYILYSNNEKNIDYITNMGYTLPDTEINPFQDSYLASEFKCNFWNNDYNYPYLQFRNIFAINALSSSVLINGMTLEEYVLSLVQK